MQEVVAKAAVDDVVGVGRPVGHVVARLAWGRVEAVGRQVHRLDELAGHVDRGLLDLAGRVDEKAQVARGKGSEAIERFAIGAGHAIGVDPAAVAENAVVAGADGDPVVAVAAGNRVVLAFRPNTTSLPTCA